MPVIICLVKVGKRKGLRDFKLIHSQTEGNHKLEIWRMQNCGWHLEICAGAKMRNLCGPLHFKGASHSIKASLPLQQCKRHVKHHHLALLQAAADKLVFEMEQYGNPPIFPDAAEAQVPAIPTH